LDKGEYPMGPVFNKVTWCRNLGFGGLLLLSMGMKCPDLSKEAFISETEIFFEGKVAELTNYDEYEIKLNIIIDRVLKGRLDSRAVTARTRKFGKTKSEFKGYESGKTYVFAARMDGKELKLILPICYGTILPEEVNSVLGK
jgi:hypothetical protein